MAEKRSKWLIGCGIGCGAILLIVIVLIASGVVFLRRTTSGFENSIGSRQTLEDRFGDTAAFVPPADGAVPPERMEAFLAVRDALADERERLEETFGAIVLTADEVRELDQQRFGEKMRSVFGITRSALGLAPGMGDLFDARNRALLENGMGLGEYTYIYVLAYHVWLGHPPTEGPETLTGESPEELATAPQLGRAMARPRRVHDELLSMLRNQLAAIPDEPSSTEPRDALAAEIERMEKSRSRLPWQDDLPPAIAASFEPYRERLQAAYSPATNPFELLRNVKRGWMSYTVE